MKKRIILKNPLGLTKKQLKFRRFIIKQTENSPYFEDCPIRFNPSDVKELQNLIFNFLKQKGYTQYHSGRVFLNLLRQRKLELLDKDEQDD